MDPWSSITTRDVQDACAAGELIVAGPLNNAYLAVLAGQRVFVRQRTVHDAEYGQTFAAERFVYGLLGPTIRVPPLLLLRGSAGRLVYAVFELRGSQEA